MSMFDALTNDFFYLRNSNRSMQAIQSINFFIHHTKNYIYFLSRSLSKIVLLYICVLTWCQSLIIVYYFNEISHENISSFQPLFKIWIPFSAISSHLFFSLIIFLFSSYIFYRIHSHMTNNFSSFIARWIVQKHINVNWISNSY